VKFYQFSHFFKFFLAVTQTARFWPKLLPIPACPFEILAEAQYHY
jgi:hypothetical protein